MVLIVEIASGAVVVCVPVGAGVVSFLVGGELAMTVIGEAESCGVVVCVPIEAIDGCVCVPA